MFTGAYMQQFKQLFALQNDCSTSTHVAVIITLFFAHLNELEEIIHFLKNKATNKLESS